MLTGSCSTSTSIHNQSRVVSHMSSIGGSVESNTSTHEYKTQHTLTNLHLEGSQIFSLHKLQEIIHTITQHSAACKSPIELIREVISNALSSALLTRCNRCNKEFFLHPVAKLI